MLKSPGVTLKSFTSGGSARRGNRLRFVYHFDRKPALLSHMYLGTVHRISKLCNEVWEHYITGEQA